jgi:hypothetical protein
MFSYWQMFCKKMAVLDEQDLSFLKQVLGGKKGINLPSGNNLTAGEIEYVCHRMQNEGVING